MAAVDAASSEALARAYFERVAARDPDGMMRFWQPGGIGHIHGVVELRAPDTYREWFANFFAAVPDLAFEIEELIADADHAAVRWRATGTFDGTKPFEGIDPTGDPIEMKGVDLLTVRDGKLISLHAYTNSVELARQLGALPRQGSRAEALMNGAFNLKTRLTRRLRRLRRPDGR